MKKLIGLLVFLGLLVGVRTFSAPPNDEENLINLEKEWSQHSNFTQQDADYVKSMIGKEFLIIFPQGESSTLTPSTVDAEFAKARAADPVGKMVFEYSDIKPHVSGDVAVVTYNQKTTGTGFKNPDLNPTSLTSVADTWQKQSGKWKALCSANVPRQPLPKGVYTSQPTP
jgi:ketosteroid isomerase-like protein